MPSAAPRPPAIRRLGARSILFTFFDLGTFEAGYTTNVVVVLGKKRNFVLDTFLGPASMAPVREVLAREGGRKPVVVFDSHSDWDHVFGNCAFPRAAVAGTARCRSNLLAHGGEMLRGFAEWRRGRVRLVPPDLVFENRLDFPEDGVTLLAAPGHTLDSAVASIADPDGPILFAGDDVERPLPCLSQPDLALYRRTLEGLLALAPKVVVPGHGEPEGPELVRATMDYLADLAAGRDDAWRAGPCAGTHAANRRVIER